MTCTLVLPVKPFAEGKSRLASALPATERERLARTCFLHVLETVRSAAADLRVEVHSRCPEVLKLSGSAAVREQGDTLNAVLEAARQQALKRADTHFIILFADLPLLAVADVQVLVQATRRTGLALAPDRAGTGTNALGLSLACDLPFLFGQNSSARFMAAAHARGYVPERVLTPGLATDLDTPEDLALVQQQRPWVPFPSCYRQAVS